MHYSVYIKTDASVREGPAYPQASANQTAATPLSQGAQSPASWHAVRAAQMTARRPQNPVRPPPCMIKHDEAARRHAPRPHRVAPRCARCHALCAPDTPPYVSSPSNGMPRCFACTLSTQNKTPNLLSCIRGHPRWPTTNGRPTQKFTRPIHAKHMYLYTHMHTRKCTHTPPTHRI